MPEKSKSSRKKNRDEEIHEVYQTWKGSIYELAEEFGVKVNDVYKAIGQPESVKKELLPNGQFVEVDYEK